MDTITDIHARQILDSRGYPTVEVDVLLSNHCKGRASVPSGASTGAYEMLELRDGDPQHFKGQSVLQAIAHVNTSLRQALLGERAIDQSRIDRIMIDLDHTPNKQRLGANSILGISLATARAAADYQQKPLYHYLADKAPIHLPLSMPVPMMNVINGGAHADNNLDLQELMILPIGIPCFSEAVRCGMEIIAQLKTILKSKGLSTSVGDEGGFAPNLSSHEQALSLLMQSIEQAGYLPGQQVALGLDIAASQLYQHGFYHLPSEGKRFTTEEWIDLLSQWVDQYPIISIEDGMDENDWVGWHKLTQRLGDRIQLVGDDLFVTQTHLLQKGIAKKVANAILIKPNQVGTLTETLETLEQAQKSGYRCIISHRSGETEDTFIADLAVALGSGQIKTGSLCRSERVAKYNQLLRLSEILGDKAPYAGWHAFSSYNHHQVVNIA